MLSSTEIWVYLNHEESVGDTMKDLERLLKLINRLDPIRLSLLIVLLALLVVLLD